MKKKLFLGFFGSLQVFLIFWQVHKQSKLIQLSYQKQKNEKIVAELNEQKKKLMHEQQTQKNPAAIKKFAHEVLHMEPMKIAAIKKLTQDDYGRAL